MDEPGAPTLRLPRDLLERVIAACDRFESALRAGEGPRIEDHLALAREEDRSILLRELLGIEVELRLGQGEAPDASGYRARFAGQEAIVDAVFAEAAAANSRRAGGPGSRFQVIRPHARGGLGQVFVALDRDFNREVALKEIRPELADRPESRARFLLEAEVTGQLEHPGIVPAYGFGLDASGRPYYAMRMIQGRSLQQAIEELEAAPAGARRLEFRKLLGRFVVVCEAVAYAHSRGVLHRDLKPANILLGPYGETLVVDWGLAKVVGRDDPAPAAGLAPSTALDATVAGAAMGTPGFMAPEQAVGQTGRIGPASDTYSLGATLYTLITGRIPFRESDRARVIDRIVTGDFPRPRAVDRGVPASLESICLKAMALEPADRYASPRHLADDIERWLADEPVSSRREGPVERLARWFRRNRARTAAALLASAAVCVVSIAAAIRIDAERRRADIERRRADVGRADARRQAARLAYDRAWTAHDGGDYGGGMLWLSRALDLTDPDAAREQRLIRTTMDAWRHGVCRRLFELDHGAGVVAVAISPDGRLFLTAGGNVVRFWGAADGRRSGLTLTHPGRVEAAVLSTDGALVATACIDGYVRLWEAASGRMLGQTDRVGSPRAVAFSPDGKTLATGQQAAARLWQVSDARPAGPPIPHAKTVRAVAFHRSGQSLITAGDEGIIRTWETSSQRIGIEIKTGRAINALSVRRDGGAVVAGFQDGTAQVYDLANGRPHRVPMRHTQAVSSVSFRGDGAAVLTGSTDTTAQLWDATTGRPIGEPMRHSSHVRPIAIGPDGTTAILGVGGRAVVWSLPDSRGTGRRLEHRGGVLNVAYSPDGSRLAAGGRGGRARIWDPAAGRQVGPELVHGTTIRALAFHPGGATLATASNDGSVRLWDAADGRPIGQPMPHPADVLCLDFSPDGRLLASGGRNMAVRLWDATTGAPAGPVLEQNNWVYRLRFSPDGRTLAAGAYDGRVRLWDVETRRLLHRWEHASRSPVRALAFSPDGAILAGAGNDQTARLWDVASGRALATLDHDGEVFAVAFRPDGRVIATSGFDGVMRLWDVPAGRRIAESARTVGPIVTLAFSPDGTTVASGGTDGVVRLWDSTDGMPVGEPLPHGAHTWMAAFDPGGRVLATAGEDGMVRLWDLPRAVAGDAATLRDWASLWTQRTLAVGNFVESFGLDDWRRRCAAFRGRSSALLPDPELHGTP